MVEFPIVTGGRIKGPGGWRATFGEVSHNRTRIVILDKTGAANTVLTDRMRDWLGECT